MFLTELSLLAVFLTGLLGGVHCAGMCGGIVSALGMLQQRPVKGSLEIPVKVISTPGVAVPGAAQAGTLGSGQIPGQITGVDNPVGRTSSARLSALSAVTAYNLGRIITYASLGALAGAVGSVAWLMQSVLPVQQAAYALSSMLVIVMGLYVIGVKRVGEAMESLGNQLWQRIRPAATARLRGSGFVNAVLAGALWGLVPCGMVYAVLSAALVSGSWHKGALLMLVFGLGTLPNLMLLGLSGQWLARISRRRWVRMLAGALIITLGVMGLLHVAMMLDAAGGY